MYKLDLPVDQKESAGIDRRRSQEEQRKSRVFNSKIRQIGIDRQALDQQVKEKRERECNERKSQLAYDSDAIRNDLISVLLEKRQQDDMRELNRILNEFRDLHQQPDTRREWDLYDPDALKKDKPARVCDDDPRCGISSLQKFDGEDLNNKAREKFQKEQMNEWNEKQKAAKDRAEQAQKEADRLYDLKRRELDERAVELAAAEEACRKAMNIANGQYNEALAREIDERNRLRRQQEYDDTLIHISNALKSDLLTENPAQAASSFGPRRVVPDRFKGMTPEQLQEIYKVQEDQVKDNKRRKMAEDLRNEEWNKQRIAQSKAAMVLENEEQRKRLGIYKRIAEENICLAKEQKMHQEFLNREVYTNPPTAGYFMQFNTTSR